MKTALIVVLFFSLVPFQFFWLFNYSSVIFYPLSPLSLSLLCLSLFLDILFQKKYDSPLPFGSLFGLVTPEKEEENTKEKKKRGFGREKKREESRGTKTVKNRTHCTLVSLFLSLSLTSRYVFLFQEKKRFSSSFFFVSLIRNQKKEGKISHENTVYASHGNTRRRGEGRLSD